MPGTWTIDPVHSHLGFAVRHLMVSKVALDTGGGLVGDTIEIELEALRS